MNIRETAPRITELEKISTRTDTRDYLAKAAPTREKLKDWLIVDVDAHVNETAFWSEVTERIDNEVLRYIAEAFRENRIAVRFAYEWHDDSGSWFRSYGNENWEFDEHGLMRLRIASINDLPIKESERKYHWPLGRRPDDHPGLSELGL